jgi:hypothetical protein
MLRFRLYAGSMTTSPDQEDPKEAALDDTLAATFPASDPLSSDPNPGRADTRIRNAEEETSLRKPAERRDSGDRTSA